MAAWRVDLLGDLCLRRDGEVLHRFRTRATDSVFAYLALHLGQRVPRETLIEIAWPEAEASKGQQSLRMALTALRQVLGSEGIEADRHCVRLSREHFNTDVDEFRRTRDVALYRGGLLASRSWEWVVPYALELEELHSSAALDRRAHVHDLERGQSVAGAIAAPAFETSFVGRKRELQEIEKLLASGRLVTLTGLGGSGKSRLAAELWRRRQPRSWFVGLADLSDPAQIADAIRTALEQPASPHLSATEQILDWFQDVDGILVLDNFEHLVQGSRIVTQLLERCPHLRAVVTSQVPLRLDGELEFPVGPLETESQTQGLSDSAALFEERVRAVLPSFSVTSANVHAVEELCACLDGLPLGLEIAAARARVFSPDEMLAQLTDRFEFLVARTEKRTHRHRSLRTALDWSFDRLSEADQSLLTKLSVFRGGFTLDAVSNICGSPRAGAQIETLLAHSWVERIPHSQPTRFRLLESIREYGAEFLPPKESQALKAAHAAYYQAIARACGDASFTPEEPLLHRQVEAEIHNLDAAWRWLRENDLEGALSLVEGMNWYWILKGQAKTGEARIKDVLQRIDETPRRRLGWGHHACGNFLLFQGRFAEAEQWFVNAHRIADQVGDVLLRGLASCQISHLQAELGLSEAAWKSFEASMRDLLEHGDDNWTGAGYVMGCLAGNRSGDVARGYEMGVLSVRYCRKGGYPWGLASALNELAMACYLLGDFSASLEFQAESIELKREAKAPLSLALSLADLAATLIAMGRVSEAKDALHESLKTLIEIGAPAVYPRLFGTAAELFLAERRPEAASALGTMLALCDGRVMTYSEKVAAERLRVQVGSESEGVIERARLKRLEPMIDAILAL